jgi:hypothetical protein
VIARCQTASDLIILQDGVLLRDAIVPAKAESDIYRYYEGITWPCTIMKSTIATTLLHSTWVSTKQLWTHVRCHAMQNLTLSLASSFSNFPPIAWGDAPGGRATSLSRYFRFSDTGRLINLFLRPVVDVGGGLADKATL